MHLCNRDGGNHTHRDRVVTSLLPGREAHRNARGLHDVARAELWRQHEVRLERLRTSAEHVRATVSGPVLLVDEHTVTVRAEISRIRRQLGAIVATRPYRLAEGVDLSIAHGFPGR